MATAPAPEDRVLSVGELTRSIKDLLSGSFPGVWVKGEISSYKGPHSSGHLYFNLKDPNATLGCAMFRNAAMKLSFTPKEGLEVEAFGLIDVYEPRGQYQLIIKQMRPAGIGALLAQLEELKRRLAAEGLFDAARKQPLPKYPGTIGVVTSPVGAAVKDIVTVLRARWPGVRIVLAPVKVQGEGSALEIAAAIQRFDRWGEADLLIVGRGGGSIEDLWAFNEEPVVRAIAGARTPIISAVGHEVDTTLADFAADVRAATPSNAAELAVRDGRETRHRIDALTQRIGARVRNKLERLRRELTGMLKQHGFRRVHDLFAHWQQRTDDLRDRLDAGVRGLFAAARERLQRARTAYGFREALPRRLAEARLTLQRSRGSLDDAIVARVLDRRRHALALADQLRALSPKSVLERGYALVRGPDGKFVRSAEALATGSSVTLEFARGEADATVTTIRKGGDDGQGQSRRRKQ
ncbi:MAG: exodeoxyribonuclease VII large subunit [Candidatus Eisenbacteria bacterium]